MAIHGAKGGVGSWCVARGGGGLVGLCTQRKMGKFCNTKHLFNKIIYSWERVCELRVMLTWKEIRQTILIKQLNALIHTQ
jgi:hypothetical protein